MGLSLATAHLIHGGGREKRTSQKSLEKEVRRSTKSLHTERSHSKGGSTVTSSLIPTDKPKARGKGKNCSE